MNRPAPLGLVSSVEPPRLQEVLDTAARLFDAKGYRATSLADIGAALGMNKASLYYYVRGKEDLLQRLIIRAAARLRDMSRDPELARLPAPTALERLVREHCRVVFDYPHEFGVLILQRRHFDPAVLEEIGGRERAYASQVRAVLERGMAEGSMRTMNAAVAARLVMDAVNSLLRWYRRDGRLDRETVADELWAFVRHAVGAGA